MNKVVRFRRRSKRLFKLSAVLAASMVGIIGLGGLGCGAGHRNYGWRTREGLHPTLNGGPVFFTPLTDPFYEYSHATGQCIIGGFIYRGSGLASSLKGRYFYGDYVSGRLWSIPFATGSNGEAVSTSLPSAIDHTASINSTLGSNHLSGPVAVNPDANGEIMICDINTGNLLRLVSK